MAKKVVIHYIKLRSLTSYLPLKDEVEEDKIKTEKDLVRYCADWYSKKFPGEIPF